MTRIASFDADSVNEKAYELYVEDIRNSEYDESEFETWVLDIKQINEDEFNLDYDNVVVTYEDEFIEYFISQINETPDKYIYLAGEYFTDEAYEYGYRARFTD